MNKRRKELLEQLHQITKELDLSVDDNMVRHQEDGKSLLDFVSDYNKVKNSVWLNNVKDLIDRMDKLDKE